MRLAKREAVTGYVPRFVFCFCLSRFFALMANFFLALSCSSSWRTSRNLHTNNCSDCSAPCVQKDTLQGRPSPSPTTVLRSTCRVVRRMKLIRVLVLHSSPSCWTCPGEFIVCASAFIIYVVSNLLFFVFVNSCVFTPRKIIAVSDAYQQEEPDAHYHLELLVASICQMHVTTGTSLNVAP